MGRGLQSVPQIQGPLPYVNTVPGWLGPTLMLFGVATLVLWGIDRLLPQIPFTGNHSMAQLLMVLVVLGTTFVTAGALGITKTVGVSALGLFAAGRFVEGGAVVRTFRKWYHAIRTRSFPGGKAKIRYVVIRIAVGLITSIFLYGVLLYGGLSNPPLFVLTLIWTLGTFTLAVIGLSWKLGSADALPTPIVIGLLLTFSGATVYDYANLAGDALHILIGVGAFLIGILAGAIAVLTR